ncbi:helix-turn-helix domain-containing protein [Mangrovicella endophytica]|uniref:helix-turn-helix domain-containing protein n=1 Tax=Mangrovicella endophytica TaxID=2066697 RepID=UPI001FE034F8|nr:AraC family transcriptional regulator [Mangrovicella endophytica]
MSRKSSLKLLRGPRQPRLRLERWRALRPRGRGRKRPGAPRPRRRRIDCGRRRRDVTRTGSPRGPRASKRCNGRRPRDRCLGRGPDAERGDIPDVDLNLDRIARRLRRPARDVSGAINRTRGMSVSQYVNGYRVERACRLLLDTADPITRIMLDAGFGTKSNFNREFQRVTGMTPSAYRRAKGRPSGVSTGDEPDGAT